MATKRIHDWIVALGFDASEVDKGINKVEKSMQKLNKIQFQAGSMYQNQLNKQVRTLREQERIMKGISKEMSKSNSKQQIVRSQRSSSVTNNRQASLDANKYALGKSFSTYEKDVKSRSTISPDAQRKVNFELDQFRAKLKQAGNVPEIRKIRSDFRGLQQDILRTERAQKQLNKQMTASKFAMKGVGDSFKNMARGYLSVFAAVGAGVAVFNKAKELDTIKATFLASTGSAEAAAEQFEYVKDISKSMGVDLATTAKGLSQLAVAGKEAGLSMAQTRDIFEAASMASVSFGLSADDAHGTLRALTQMLSKNKITAEELNMSRLAT